MNKGEKSEKIMIPHEMLNSQRWTETYTAPAINPFSTTSLSSGHTGLFSV